MRTGLPPTGWSPHAPRAGWATDAFLGFTGLFPRTLRETLAFRKLDFVVFPECFEALDLVGKRLLETFFTLTFLDRATRLLTSFFALPDDFALVDFFARLALEATFFLAKPFFVAMDFLTLLAFVLFPELTLTAFFRLLDLVLEVEVLDFARLAFVLFDLEIDFTTSVSYTHLTLPTNREV